MAADLASPQDVRLNEPGPICQDSKKRRPFADEYACLGMHSPRLRFRKNTRLGVNSGTKTEISHGECEDQGASSDRPSMRPGVSCWREAVNLQQPPKPRLHPWDTSVFLPESRVRGVLFVRRTRYLSNIRQNRGTCGKSKRKLSQLIPADQSRHPDPRRHPQSRQEHPPNRIIRLDAVAEIARREDTSSGHYPALSPYRPIRFRSTRLLIGNSFEQNA